MLSSIHRKSFHSVTIFSFKSPSSSSLTSTKLKKLAYTLVSRHSRHVARAFAKTKLILAQIVNKIHIFRFIDYLKGNNNDNNKSKRFFGSFRFHYNWGSSNVLPVPPHVLNECHVYYDSTWNSIVVAECDDVAAAGLSGYLHWLEDQFNEKSTRDYQDEIDKLADTFIASCHEKFKLEKEESYRRYQDMMARSV